MPRVSMCFFCGKSGIVDKPETIKHHDWCSHMLGESDRDKYILRNTYG